MSEETVRQRSNGTIDLDHYRSRALMLREQVRTEVFRGMAAAARPLCGGLVVVGGAVLALHLIFAQPAEAELPDAVAVNGETLVATVHAVGAQVYECKSDSLGRRVWQFREPIATLVSGGATVGRHYAGPSWELADGSAVSAKAVSSAPGATAGDIALLKLSATSTRGAGKLSGVTSIQRINTSGGNLDGACESFGAFRSVPYTADYVFFRKPGEPLSQRSN